MDKAEIIARELNRALDGKSEWLKSFGNNGKLDAEDYAAFANSIADIEGVSLHWLGTAGSSPLHPIAQVLLYKQFRKRPNREYLHRDLGHIRRQANGVWIATKRLV